MYDHKHQQNGPASSEGYNINNHNCLIYLFYTWSRIVCSHDFLCFVSFTARFGNNLTGNLPPANQLQNKNKKARMYHYQDESDKEDKQLKMR